LRKKPNVHAAFAQCVIGAREVFNAMKPPSVDKFSQRFAEKTAKADEKRRD
jgi:hypothetical protein